MSKETEEIVRIGSKNVRIIRPKFFIVRECRKCPFRVGGAVTDYIECGHPEMPSEFRKLEEITPESVERGRGVYKKRYRNEFPHECPMPDVKNTWNIEVK